MKGYSLLSPQEVEKQLKDEYYFNVLYKWKYRKVNQIKKNFVKNFCIPKKLDNRIIEYIITKLGRRYIGKLFMFRRQVIHHFFKKIRIIFGVKFHIELNDEFYNEISWKFRSMLKQFWLLRHKFYKFYLIKRWGFFFLYMYYFNLKKEYIERIKNKHRLIMQAKERKEKEENEELIKDKSKESFFKFDLKKKIEENKFKYKPLILGKEKNNHDPYQVAFDFKKVDTSKIAELSFFSFSQLVQYGVHLGHVINVKSVYAAWLTYGIRDNILIISLSKFINMLRIGFLFVDKAVFTMGPIWFTSMFQSYFENVIHAAITCGELSCTSEWINGLLSNFLVVFKTLSMYRRFPKDLRPKGLHISLDMNNWLLGRFSWPRVVFVTGFTHSSFIGREAISLRIPCLSIMDTDSPSHISSVPIPGNDSSWYTNAFYCEVLSSFILYRKAVYAILWFISVRRSIRKLKFSEWLSTNLEKFNKLNEKKSLISNLIEDHEFNFFFKKEASSVFLEQLAFRFFIFKGPVDENENTISSFFFLSKKKNELDYFWLEEKESINIIEEENKIKELENKLLYSETFSVSDELELARLKRKREYRKDILNKKEKPYYKISEKYVDNYFWTAFNKIHNYLIISHSIYLLKSVIWNRNHYFLNTRRKNNYYSIFPKKLRKWKRRRYKRKPHFKWNKISVFFPRFKKRMRHLKKCFATKAYRFPRKNKKIRRFLKSFSYNNFIFNYKNNKLFKKFTILKKKPRAFTNSKFFRKVIRYRKRYSIKKQYILTSLLNFGKRNKFFKISKKILKENKIIKKEQLQWDLDFFRNRWLKSFFLGRRFTLFKSKSLLRSLLKSYFDFFFFFFTIQQHQDGLNIFNEIQKSVLFTSGKLFFFFSFIFQFRALNYFSLTQKYTMRSSFISSSIYNYKSGYIINRYYSYLVNYDPEMLLLSFNRKNDFDFEIEFNKKLNFDFVRSKTMRVFGSNLISEEYLHNYYYLRSKINYKKENENYFSIFNKHRTEKAINSQFSIFNLSYRKFFFKVCDISSNDNLKLNIDELASLFSFLKLKIK